MPRIGDIELREVQRPNRKSGITHYRFIYVQCPACFGHQRWVRLIKGKPVSLFCHHCKTKESWKEGKHPPNPRGSKSSSWKGGKIITRQGYVAISLQPDDFFYPMVMRYGYVLEHRLVMAKHLNRCLLSWEIVHHKNGIRNDNRIENLELLPASYKHTTITKLTNHIRKLEHQMAQLQSEYQRQMKYRQTEEKL